MAKITLPPEQRKACLVLSLGHLCSDINQGTLSALLPFLAAAHHYNYTTAALLVMVSNLAGSVIQPLFGHWADRTDRPAFMLWGVALAGGGMALTGLLDNFYALCTAVIVSGLGVALFHPEAAKLVHAFSSQNAQGTLMGIFSFGGNLGFTLGPLLAFLGISLWGLPGTLIFLLPPLFFTLAAARFTPQPSSQTKEQQSEAASAATPQGTDDAGAFARLSALITLRSIIKSGFSTFLALYLIHVLAQSESLSSTLLSAFYAVTAFSALLGGRLADQWGEKRTIVFACTLLLLGLLAFPLAPTVLAAALQK